MVRFFAALLACVLIVPAAKAATVTIDGSTPLAAFMEVFELPANGGGFVFNGGWGVPDAVAIQDAGADTLTLSPNTIGDPNEFWYQNTSGTAADPTNPGGPGQLGNKFMEANVFASDNSLTGEEITFSVEVLSNTFTAAHNTVMWIRDFEPDFSSFVDSEIAIGAPGTYSVTLNTINDPARNIQYGFTTSGENVWVTDTAPFGSVVIGPTAVPEPTSMILVGLGLMGMAAGSRRS